MSPLSFTPLEVGGVTLPNRIVVAPMCQYVADDGCMNDWHFVHLGQLAISGAGLLMLEATHITREGRITHGCVGLYNEHNEAAMARVVANLRRLSKNPIGLQIGHAGRKGSSQVPWEGRDALRPGQSPWETVAPSAIAYGEGWHVPRALERDEIRALVDAFAACARRAVRLGFDVLELHSAHGYLLHQFLSPISNRRTDAYGADRMKFPLEVAQAVRETWPRERALGARINAMDWIEGGLGIEDAIAYAQALEHAGFDYVCVSTGALSDKARIAAGPGYLVPFAKQVKRALKKTKVRAVGLIATPEQVEAILRDESADMVAMARAFLDNPRWVWHAAQRCGIKLDYPPPYERSRPDLWPGARLARPA